ncbi:hypothetical protein ABZ805_13875 [Saccharopolyspora sp. NPDC047091]|uniref:hypothetical protein n=1 Tax=Saccharopolyspora sp. NPDC047091 TaxID=3155924 RepID=UPI0033F78EAA
MTANLRTATRGGSAAPAATDRATERPDPVGPRAAPAQRHRGRFAPSCGRRPGASRHGALTRPVAEELLGADGLSAELDAGRWVEPWGGVVLPARRARDPLARAEAALLRAGPHAVLTGPTAAAMHGCTEAFDEAAVHLAVPYHRQPRSVRGLSIKQMCLRESEVLELDGLRVHALEIALVEMLCTGERRTALACLEQALAALGPAAARFHAVVAEQVDRRRDRRGTRRACELLDLARLGPSGAIPVIARIEAAAPPATALAGRPGGAS